MSDELANEALHYAREYIRAHADLIPEWMIARLMGDVYPGGFTKFLIDYRFVNREAE